MSNLVLEIEGRVRDLNGFYKDRSVLVLGGDGFIGVHTTKALLALGARVSILTRRDVSLHEGSGVTVFRGDLADKVLIERALQGQEIVFDLAGSAGGVESNRDPCRHFLNDCVPHLQAFQVAAEQKVPPLIVFCSSRTVYGKTGSLPVGETHPIAPLTLYATQKVTLENSLRVFHGSHGLRHIIFRLSNPYGPYPEDAAKSYGVINQFIHKANQGETITLFGDGKQVRDYVYIDDVVETFLRAASQSDNYQETYNLGGAGAISVKGALDTLEELCPKTTVESVEWPSDYKSVETGDYVTDLSKLRKEIGDTVRVTFREGVERTLKAKAKIVGSTSGFKRSRTKLNRNFWRGKRVVITGASGFLGMHLVKRLTQSGAIVGAVHRKSLEPWLLCDQQVWTCRMDISEDKEGIKQFFEEFRPEVVYHLASAPDGQETDELIHGRMNSNVLGTYNLLVASKSIGVEAFILGDTCKVYGNGEVPHREHSLTIPTNSYATTKLTAWNFCKVFHDSFGLPVAALRPTLIYGPGEGPNLFGYLARSIVERVSEIVLDGGQQTRDPLFVSDAVEAYIRLAENMDKAVGRSLPLGGGQEENVENLARQFVAGSDFPVLVRGEPDRIRQGEMLRSFCDNSEVMGVLSWRPSVNRVEAFKHTLEFHMAKQSGDAMAFMQNWFDFDYPEYEMVKKNELPRKQPLNLEPVGSCI